MLNRCPIVIHSFAFLLLLTQAIPAEATFIAFGDRTTWLAAAGTLVGEEDFESFTSDTSFNFAPLALADGITIGTAFPAPLGDNFVDVPPADRDETDVNGTAHARVLNLGLETPFLLFATPITAFGADFKNLNDEILRTEIELYAGATLLATLTPSTEPDDEVSFWGFASDAGEEVTEIRFRYVADERFGMDDLAIGTTVPEPGTVLLLAAGLAGLSARRRSAGRR